MEYGGDGVVVREGVSGFAESRRSRGAEELGVTRVPRSTRLISPSQHRPLDSTPLVETKSDTRKAKLLQMHKPPLLRPFLCFLFYPTTGPFQPLCIFLTRSFHSFIVFLLPPPPLLFRPLSSSTHRLYTVHSLLAPSPFLPFRFRGLLLSATHFYSVNPFHRENVVLQFTLFFLSFFSYALSFSKVF